MKNPKIDMYIGPSNSMSRNYQWSSYRYRTCRESLAQYNNGIVPKGNTITVNGIKYSSHIDHNKPKL